MIILGIWDGHDSGAAIMNDGRVLAAVNEERFSRRKLEVSFPARSILESLDLCNLNPTDIDHIAVSTKDVAKTVARLFPSSKESYYRIRRRLQPPGLADRLRKRLKYRITEWSGSLITEKLSHYSLASELGLLGLSHIPLHLCDHHDCHAATAAWFSGFSQCTVLTLDGVGDGVSGTVSLLERGKLQTLVRIGARDSLGIFFEHVTNLLNMRELEDEGKVMALADFAPKLADADNPLLNLFAVEGLEIRARINGHALYRYLERTLFQNPMEQFAHMAQECLERVVKQWVQNAIATTKQNNLALAGGLFANIKLNATLRNMPEIDGCYIFPHMGDGGLAVGAASQLYKRLRPDSEIIPLQTVALGRRFDHDVINASIIKNNMRSRTVADPAKEAARLICAGEIIGWFQGGMEYGPRALGQRSILALADKPRLRHEINMALKRRAWYQPFCPSMLEGEAKRLLVDYDGVANRFMTMIYHFKDEFKELFAGVSGMNGSCRPQIVTRENGPYFRLLQELQAKTGYGIVLNTSFNQHGQPLVNSPDDALQVLQNSPMKFLLLENQLVESR